MMAAVRCASLSEASKAFAAATTRGVALTDDEAGEGARCIARAATGMMSASERVRNIFMGLH